MGQTLLERAIAKARRTGAVRADFARTVLGCSRYHLWRATSGRRDLDAAELAKVRAYLAGDHDSPSGRV